MNKKDAIEMYNTNWWENKSASVIAKTQLEAELRICPLDIFHSALESSLNREVQSFELRNFESLLTELNQKKP